MTTLLLDAQMDPTLLHAALRCVVSLVDNLLLSREVPKANQYNATCQDLSFRETRARQYCRRKPSRRQPLLLPHRGDEALSLPALSLDDESHQKLFRYHPHAICRLAHTRGRCVPAENLRYCHPLEIHG